MRWIILSVLLCAATEASAYCVHNQADRDIRVEQEEHPNDLRNDRRLRVTLKPGESKCCQVHELDCNPLGRNNSVVKLEVTVPGTPAYQCAPPGPDQAVKVTGNGTIRVQPNPNKKSANPYIVRIATMDKDLTGPAGVACQEPQAKQVSPPKGKK